MHENLLEKNFENKPQFWRKPQVVYVLRKSHADFFVYFLV